ncbi:uncharacterized protein LOC144102184 [Amblyomma americanum]
MRLRKFAALFFVATCLVLLLQSTNASASQPPRAAAPPVKHDCPLEDNGLESHKSHNPRSHPFKVDAAVPSRRQRRSVEDNPHLETAVIENVGVPQGVNKSHVQEPEPRPQESNSEGADDEYAKHLEVVADHLDLDIGLRSDDDFGPSSLEVALSSDVAKVKEHAVITIADVERVARLTLQPQAKRYFFSGADRQQTLKENTAAFRRLRFRPRPLVDVQEVNMTTTVLGHKISMPIGFAPAAMHALAHPHGETGTALAAQEAETVMILSSFSTTKLEDVRMRAPRCLLWFQTYMFRDRALTEWLVKRASRVGYSAIVLTADSPVVGHKLEPVRNRVVSPPNTTFANLKGWPQASSSKSNSESTHDKQADEFLSRSVSWDDISWLKRISGLPIVVKGVLTREAAISAYHHGADAIIVSNHGGRQLDGSPASIEALPEIASAVGGRLEIYLDSGVRSGADVAKALSLGARAVFVGRPIVWGLAYDGKEGVDRILEILRSEFQRTLQLLGCRNSSNLNSGFVTHQSRYAQTKWRNFPRQEL